MTSLVKPPFVLHVSVHHEIAEASKHKHEEHIWVFITGGCSGRGMQQMGVVLYNKLVYNII